MELLQNFNILKPKASPIEDLLFNRRRLAFYGLGFSIYWVHLILLVYVIKSEADAASIIAFLGVPSTIAGLGFYKYLRAAEVDDEHKRNVTISSGSNDRDNTSSVE